VTNVAQQQNLLLYAADNKMLKQYHQTQQKSSTTTCNLSHAPATGAGGANSVNPACPLHGHHGHTHNHAPPAKPQGINSAQKGILPTAGGSTVISYQIPDLNRSMGQKVSNTNVGSPDKIRKNNTKVTNTTAFSKMTTDSTDANTTVAQTFSATSGQHIGSTVYSASA